MKPNPGIFIAGLAIIVVTNLVALGGVAYNRSGEADAVVELTEREVRMPYRYGFYMDTENTGLGLNISCRNCWGSPVWLDLDKLVELGFEPGSLEEDREWRLDYDKSLPRDFFLVLEYNGAAHQRAIANEEKELAEEQALLADNPDNEEFEYRVKYAQSELDEERHRASRLFAIDAGQDRSSLRNAYPDSAKYIIMRALIRQTWEYDENEKKIWVGRIEDLLIDTINVPLEHRAIFEPLEDQPRNDQEDQSPRYKLSVAFGKRLEPWVLRVEEM